MDQQNGTAAAHHPERRNRRVDSAREETRQPPARASRQTTRTRFFAEVVEGVLRKHLDVNRERGIVEVDRPSSHLLDPTADLPLDLRRGERESLVGPAYADAKRGGRSLAEIRQDAGRQLLKVQ